jgi:hypothetical protein
MCTVKKYISLVAAATTLLLCGCKKWDDHNEKEAALHINLLEEINNRPDLSTFSEMLIKTGLDQELAGSKTYTVWAPTNDALQNLDQAIVNDTAQLKAFLKNHIAGQSYYTRMAQPVVRAQMLNGKRITFENNKFDEATITEADRYVKNGVLHVIDKYIKPLPSIWEFVGSTTSLYRQNNFVKNYIRKVFDPVNAVIEGINPRTGEPVYRPGTDSVEQNIFNVTAYDLKNEDSLYTYVVLQDPVFAAEIKKFQPYFKTGSADSTNTFSAWNTVRDLAGKITAYPTSTPNQVIFTSKFNVTDTIPKTAIVETRKCSNGIVYIVSSIRYAMREKFPPVILQGEFPFGFSENKRSNTYYRVRTDTATGTQFNDIVMINHGVSEYKITYRLPVALSTTYKVSWVAINDFQTTTFQQRLAMGTAASTTFNYITVPLNSNKEVSLGEYPVEKVGELLLYLTSAKSTTNGQNSLTLDYIKLEPTIQ